MNGRVNNVWTDSHLVTNCHGNSYLKIKSHTKVSDWLTMY